MLIAVVEFELAAMSHLELILEEPPTLTAAAAVVSSARMQEGFERDDGARRNRWIARKEKAGEKPRLRLLDGDLDCR
jgi:hypothetical protein